MIRSSTLARGSIGLLVLAAFASLGAAAATEPSGPEVSVSTAAPSRAPSDTRAPAWRDASGQLVEVTHWLPGPARRQIQRDPADRLSQERECQRCHPLAAQEWTHSQHASAWSGAAFQRAFEIEPLAYCRHCHAPEEDATGPAREVSAAAATLGVGCVTCHVQPGTDEVWAVPRPDADEIDARSPHAIRRSVAFAGPQACAACHEFPFPDAALRDRPLAMQSTISEHSRSPAADRSCASCHMPRTAAGHRSHAFVGAYDRSTLARSIIVEATRPGARTIVLRLAPGDVGHAVPTGDLLRRLEVEIAVQSPGEHAEGFSARRYLGRRFGPVRQAQGLVLRGEHADTRVGVGPDGGVRVARFTVPAALADRPIEWRVTHQRVAHGSADPRRAPVEGEQVIARGTLAPLSSYRATTAL